MIREKCRRNQRHSFGFNFLERMRVRSAVTLSARKRRPALIARHCGDGKRPGPSDVLGIYIFLPVAKLPKCLFCQGG